jgi:hypothetical protein
MIYIMSLIQSKVSDLVILDNCNQLSGRNASLNSEMGTLKTGIEEKISQLFEEQEKLKGENITLRAEIEANRIQSNPPLDNQ